MVRSDWLNKDGSTPCRGEPPSPQNKLIALDVIFVSCTHHIF